MTSPTVLYRPSKESVTLVISGMLSVTAPKPPVSLLLWPIVTESTRIPSYVVFAPWGTSSRPMDLVAWPTWSPGVSSTILWLLVSYVRSNYSWTRLEPSVNPMPQSYKDAKVLTPWLILLVLNVCPLISWSMENVFNQWETFSIWPTILSRDVLSSLRETLFYVRFVSRDLLWTLPRPAKSPIPWPLQLPL